VRDTHQGQRGRQQYYCPQTDSRWLTRLQKKVGLLIKETPNGPFADEWKKTLGDIATDAEEVDMAPILSNAALAIKDERELIAIRDASRASSRLMKDYFVEEMSGILDDEKKVSNSKLAQQISDKIDESAYFKKM
jgi:nucleosome binding factor SPN SPT16 subunit